jgi:predicted ribosome quality control (RQC) complex YloA/Tae2 family protein
VQHNYYFLKHLSPALHIALQGLPFVSCFSQNKDELLLGFANQEKGFYIKAVLTPILCCLSFPETFNRSRRNSIDLFQSAIGYTVLNVRQLDNERGFLVCLAAPPTQENSTHKYLLFKMQGQRSNILLFEAEDLQNPTHYTATEIFKNELANDWEIDFAKLDREIDQSEQGFMANRLQKTYPTFDKTMLKALEKFANKSITEVVYGEVQDFLKTIENPTFYIAEQAKELSFTLFKPENILFETQNPLIALNEFQRIFNQTYYFEAEKNEALKGIELKIKQTQNYILKTEEKLWELIGKISYQQTADIIMANLHTLPTEPLRIAQTVELFDFYNNENIKIKLKENLTPQKTAENYYRKSKNQKIEIDKLEKNIQDKQTLLANLIKTKEEIASFTEFKTLRNTLQINYLVKEKHEEEQHLFKKFECEGFEIWIGKNAKNNDLLTQRYAYKEDLWLHARDVAGSHVVIKHQAGKKIPNTVIEKAAQLAAYFSKRKSDSLCPVIVTPKKYVRKPKGAADGMVKIEREQVVMVVPSL